MVDDGAGATNTTRENSRKQAPRTRTEKEISRIDKEMQRRILDLHDKMEESGLSGAVNLIEQLFDNKPGNDVKQKKRLKAKYRAGMNEVTKGKNVNSNRSKSPDKLNIPIRKGSDHNLSEVTIYQNVVQKRVSSSEEDRLDVSDESNLLHNLILDEVSVQAGESQQLPQVQPSTRAQPDRNRGGNEVDPTDHALNMIRLSEKAKANMCPPKGQHQVNNLNQPNANFETLLKWIKIIW